LHPNQYKDGKQITKTMRALYRDGKLNPLQASHFSSKRPAEELYDIRIDSWEINNLAQNPENEAILKELRKTLKTWMKETRDMGLIPEPELEDLGKQYGNKYAAMKDEKQQDLVDELYEVIELGEKGPDSIDDLILKLDSQSPSVRFRAAYEIGDFRSQGRKAYTILKSHLQDKSGSVRIACARALARMGRKDGLPVLQKELKENSNHVVRHFAALFFEDVGKMARPYLKDFEQATQDSYEFVRRVANRLVRTFTS
jgi:uncharacterized sulfatase